MGANSELVGTSSCETSAQNEAGAHHVVLVQVPRTSGGVILFNLVVVNRGSIVVASNPGQSVLDRGLGDSEGGWRGWGQSLDE